MAVTTVQKFLDQLSKNKDVRSFVTEFNKLSTELRKRGHDLNKRISVEGEKTLHQAREKALQAVKAAGITQGQLDREVNKAVLRIRKSAAELEKGLESYRKRALAQKARLEKMLAASRKKSSKKSAKKTSKKAAAPKKARRLAKKA